MNEDGSPDIAYSVSGGTTIVPDFTLNDESAQIPIRDMGAAENGRLWVVSDSNILYYRDANSAIWVRTSVTDAAKVDGGPDGACFYINTVGTVFSYADSGVTAQISATGEFPAIWSDIGSGWTGTPTGTGTSGPALYVVKDDSILYKYSGSGTTWNVYTTLTTPASFTGYRVDVNPVSGNVYVLGKPAGSQTVQEIAPAAIPVISNLGTPVFNPNLFRDLAVNANGEIFVTALNGSWRVYRYNGSGWVSDIGTFDASNITGGVGNAMWLTVKSGSWSNPSYPFNNIFSRAANGTAVTYLDDERLRTTTGNSQLIPVNAGTYTITETVPGGWDLQKISLYDPTANSNSNLATNSATIDVAAGEVVHVVFQTGELNSFTMTNSCVAAYLETFGTGTLGSFGDPVDGQTSYHYLTGNAPGEDGHYKIVNRANPDFNTWVGAAGVIDHTPGDDDLGYMYAVNAGFEKGEFFRRRFTGVVLSAVYDFSAWVINLTPSAGIKPNVSFLVLNHATQDTLAIYTTGALTGTTEPGSWQQYGFTFTATTTDIDLVISNNGAGGNGNDLALDDISFTMAPPNVPVTTVSNIGCNASGTGSIAITNPLGVSYEYSIDNINWQSSPLFTGLDAAIYTVSARFAATADCISSRQDTVRQVICGNVFNDANGISDTIVNGSGTNAGIVLYAILYDETSGKVMDIATVNSDGTFSLSAIKGNNASIYVSTVPASIGQNTIPVVVMPDSWIATGENNCGITPGCTGNDDTPDGILYLETVTGAISQINFGIEQKPITNDVAQSIPYPMEGDIPAGWLTTQVSGSDPEQGIFSGTNASIIIDTLPANAIMIYDDVLVSAGDTILSFDPSLLSVENIAAGSASVSFDYSFFDAADAKSDQPGTYTIIWGTPLPVTFVNFDAYKNGDTSILEWTTASEKNNKGFEIERSYDGRSWDSLGFAFSRSNDGNSSQALSYLYTDHVPQPGSNYYRLKQFDFDGRHTYSPIRFVMFDNLQRVAVYPNPVHNELQIQGLSGVNKITISNTVGQIIIQVTANNVRMHTIDMSRIANGMYFVTINNENGRISTYKVIKE